MVPSRVSQAFEFSDRAPHVVSPGSRQVAGGRCPFEKEVLVSRLYRWTHLITSYSVWQQLKESEPLLWQSDSHWVLDFPPPFLHFSAGEGFRWECVYDNTGSNTGDQAFQIGGTSSDACSLLGIYQLVSPVSGAEDDSPERCTR
jgi:hypothetical protein